MHPDGLNGHGKAQVAHAAAAFVLPNRKMYSWAENEIRGAV
jgi:hypothetical protein